MDILTNEVHYHNITKDDMLNGTGLRVVLWLSGCNHHCPGCQNPITWDCNDGLVFDDSAFNEIIEEMDKSWISGITFSGGDPLHPVNREFVGELSKYLKEKYPEKDIWLYTGYKLDKDVTGFTFKSKDDEFTFDYLDYIDIVVDGRFEQEVRQTDITAQRKVHWRGSSNQRVIDVKQSKMSDSFVCLD